MSTSNQDLFNSNLQLLAGLNPDLYQILANQNNIRSKDELFLYSLEGPSNEAYQAFRRLKLHGVHVLYFYGIGLGLTYEAAIPWLRQNPRHNLVFLEDDLSVLYYFLQTPLADALLRDPQVDIRFVTDPAFNRPAIRAITGDHILRPFAIAALPFYQTQKNQSFAALCHSLVYETEEQNIQNEELARLGSAFYHNFYPNILQLPHAYQGQALANRFKNIPAIICGAGPSLIKQLPLLKNLHQNALLFAPGSTLNILSYHGLRPHFGVNIDPTPETFHRQIMNRAYDTPIFYRNRVYCEALAAIHGPRLWIPGATLYNAAQWFEEQLKLPSLQMEGGYNVVHTAIEIAHLLGCNPIVLVGMDLSFQIGEHYAQGVERHPLFPTQNETKEHLGAPIQVKDIYGQAVWSYWPWIAESQWTGWYAETHPELELINATEAGIGFYSLPNVNFHDVANEKFSQTYDLEKMIHEAIQEAGKVPVAESQIIELMELLHQSLRQCESILTTILFKIDAFASESHGTQLEIEQELKPLEESLYQQPGYQAILMQFNDFYLKYIRKQLRQLHRIPDEKQRFEQKLSLFKERYKFILQAKSLNLHFISETLQEGSKSPESHQKRTPPSPSVQGKVVRTLYYLSGAKYSETNISSDTKDEYYTSYYEDGTLKTVLQYHDGLLSGPAYLYYPTGLPKRELHFVKGKREGQEKSWYENGQLFTEVDYHQNNATHARCWFADGTLGKDISLTCK